MKRGGLPTTTPVRRGALRAPMVPDTRMRSSAVPYTDRRPPPPETVVALLTTVSPSVAGSKATAGGVPGAPGVTRTTTRFSLRESAEKGAA